MEKGTIIEYIDRRRLICAVVLAASTTGDKRLSLYTEDGQAVNLPVRRLTYSGGRLDVDQDRPRLAAALKQTADRRNALMAQIDVPALWRRLNAEQQWITLSALKGLCFPGGATADQEAALVRAMFADSLYFKFDHNRFFPHSPEQIQAITDRREKEETRRRTVENGADWLRQVAAGHCRELSDEARKYVAILQDYYVFEQEAENKILAREILTRAGNISREAIFPLLVRLGVWRVDENTDLLRYRLPTDWSAAALTRAEDIRLVPAESLGGQGRVDLSDLFIFTIDGSATADYDDALSLEEEADGGCRVGVHISDVAHHINKNDVLDREALVRGSSIYTADQKIPMLPPLLSEDACSLRAGVDRPAISVIMRFSPFAELLEHQIVPSIVRVARHLSYNEADRTLGQERRLKKLNELSARLHQRRMQAGAMQITIPELSVQFLDKGRVMVRRLDEVSPSRMMVAEMMITANRLFAKFLSDNGVPAVFRTQAEPKQRLVKKTDGPGTLFQNWVQRKMIARVVLNPVADHHAGLGLEQYTTVTSPIRKYLDLLTQRQVKAVLGLETPYTRQEVQELIQTLEPTLGNVARIQQARQRYWALKYLESKIGDREEAVVLDGFNGEYSVLLPDYLLECRMPKPSRASFKPKDLIRVTLQHVNARNNVISIFFG